MGAADRDDAAGALNGIETNKEIRPAMLTVHHLNNSRSQRVLWLLEELGEPYEIVRYQRDPKTMLAPPELAQVHPLGKSPVVVDDGQVLAETGAIIETLLDRHGAGRLRPAPDAPDLARWRQWMHFAEGSMMPQLLVALLAGRIENSALPEPALPVARGIAQNLRQGIAGPNLERQYAWIESELQARDWLVGAFSAADIMMSFPLEAARARAGLDGRYPRTLALIERMHARPAWQRALARGGPYDYA